MTLRQKRHAAALNTLERTKRQRDKCIAKLVRLEAKLKTTARQVSRLERAAAKPDTATPQPVPQSAAPVPVPAPGPIAPSVDAAGIPDFLRRAAKASDAKDKEAAAAIKAEQAERKKQRATVQAENRKAKQRGDTKRMPLTGREALNYLRTGSRT